MTLLAALKENIVRFVKARDSVRAETLRFLLAAIRNTAIAKYGKEAEEKFRDEDFLDVVKKQVKSHKESIEAFAKAGRSDLVDKEKAELSILEEFLPKELSDDELKALVLPLASSGEKNFGLLMKKAIEAVKGQAGGGRVAAILKELISGQ